MTTTTVERRRADTLECEWITMKFLILTVCCLGTALAAPYVPPFPLNATIQSQNRTGVPSRRMAMAFDVRARNGTAKHK
ncbi:hypothetical protein E4U21_004732 [Claviceps maximensis]|nr:hypothetical protein E4U21_004732 [Claviceps maximensis]